MGSNGVEIQEQPRVGDWMVQGNGKRIYPADPRPGDFDINAIAKSLARANRFAGHSNFPYSVAQHSVLCSRQADYIMDCFQALMHDASEAFIQDIVRPAKNEIGPGYRELENRMMKAMAEQFGFNWPMSEIVHEIDNRMLVTEARFLMGHGEPWWTYPGQPKAYDILIEPWLPEYAEFEFLNTFKELKEAIDLTQW